MSFLTVLAAESTDFHADNTWLPEAAEILGARSPS